MERCSEGGIPSRLLVGVSSITLLIVAIIMLAGPVGTTVNNNVRAAAAAAVSNNNNNGTRPDHLVCFDGDARYDIQAKGYQDGVNDFNHVKHYPVVPFSMLNATEISLYRQGYHDGWMDAKVNGTAMKII